MLNQQTIKVLTFNVYIRPIFITARGNDYKRERLLEFYEKEIDNFDVITFQELFGSFTSKRKEFLELSKKKGFFHEVHSHRSICPLFPIDGGLCILSKYPIIKTKQLIYSRGCYSDSLAAKGILYALINFGNNKNIHFFTTHFQADYSNDFNENNKSRNCRQIQKKECLDFIKETVDDDNPIIFTGDMNIPGGSFEYDSFLELMHSSYFKFDVIDYLYEEKKLHLITHCELINGKRVDEVITSYIAAPSNVRIDYIFGIKTDQTNNFLKPIFSEVNKFKTKNKEFPYLSDHYGVVSMFLIE